jgi:RNA polymerase sigma factor (sigma-70 family)
MPRHQSSSPWPSLDLCQAALWRLPRLQRDALLLAARDGLSYDAIAERLGLRRARVERLLARALASLDRELSS